jgi:hypothetical protein
MQKPKAEEYNPYFDRYIDLVPEGDYHELLKTNTKSAAEFFASIAPEKHDYKYAEGKWSSKEILMHLIDTEKVMNYRALAAARRDVNIVLPNMDEDMYAKNADVTARSMESLINEFLSVRKVTEIFFENLGEEDSKFTITSDMNGSRCKISARAIGYLIPGHVTHHINIIKERYLQI